MRSTKNNNQVSAASANAPMDLSGLSIAHCKRAGEKKTRGHPYYIVAPNYLRTSAGIRALHLLCHALNCLGEDAYVLISPMVWGRALTDPSLDTPVADGRLFAKHRRQGRTPITIYPETIRGNPLQAPLVVRYVCNYPGLLGGDKTYPASEIVFGYSRRLAEAAGHRDNVLFLPASDPTIFHPAPPGAPRSGTCFYGAKYSVHHGGKFFPVTRDSIEITRDLPDSQTPSEIADLFRRSELFYCYENTALAIEAAMCGCPAVFLPNEHLTEIIASDELTSDGFAWGTDPAEIERAKQTVKNIFPNYEAAVQRFWVDLARMVERTQQAANVTPYKQPMKSLYRRTPDFENPTPGERLVHIAHLIVRAWHELRYNGIHAFVRRTIRFIKKHLSKMRA
ncbi:MAG: hypothetical protein JOZ70_12045 [Pseudolabrys sp.]|nr:hypothetical protein [Pseudolabrys sp.]